MTTKTKKKKRATKKKVTRKKTTKKKAAKKSEGGEARVALSADGEPDCKVKKKKKVTKKKFKNRGGSTFKRPIFLSTIATKKPSIRQRTSRGYSTKVPQRKDYYYVK